MGTVDVEPGLARASRTPRGTPGRIAACGTRRRWTEFTPTNHTARSGMPRETFTLELTARQATALRALAEREDLPPEVYAAEVLVKHLYHAYTPDLARRTGAPAGSDDGAGPR
jgi:hypothetical protein